MVEVSGIEPLSEGPSARGFYMLSRLSIPSSREEARRRAPRATRSASEVIRARRSLARTEPVWVAASILTHGRGEGKRGRYHAAWAYCTLAVVFSRASFGPARCPACSSSPHDPRRTPITPKPRAIVSPQGEGGQCTLSRLLRTLRSESPPPRNRASRSESSHARSHRLPSASPARLAGSLWAKPLHRPR